ncbi:MAG TPA: uracil-DNA glycosylase family protein [Acidobacteriaceae bacterium]|nr:uracil-DNA glycosylase family protein [Acidobacteriaceae bacterium]
MNATPEQQLRAYIEYFRDMGVYDLYRREPAQAALPERWRELLASGRVGRPDPAVPQVSQPKQVVSSTQSAPRLAQRPSAPPVASATPFKAAPNLVDGPPSSAGSASQSPSPFETSLPQELAAPMPKPVPFDQLAPLPTEVIAPAQRVAALEAIRADIGDCTRCPLAYAGRHTIVFADGDPNARLMFVGEGPGADEDAQGLPFVGKAGQLLNNMIGAMGLKREEVYIANIVKCRPPGNRTPEFVEASTCSQFLVRQIDIVRPQVIVALGSTAATYLLGVRQSLTSLRGRWHSTRGAKLAVTYHPAFLLRDPRQKGEAWKDLQMVMAELGLKAAPRNG